MIPNISDQSDYFVYVDFCATWDADPTGRKYSESPKGFLSSTFEKGQDSGRRIPGWATSVNFRPGNEIARCFPLIDAMS